MSDILGLENAYWRLCYVESNFAWFSPYDPCVISGDDWNDAPYEHNASEPLCAYIDGKRINVEFYIVAFRVAMNTPGDRCWGSNSKYSVEDINSKKIAWLSNSDANNDIWAGIDLTIFIGKILDNGGDVFLPYLG